MICERHRCGRKRMRSPFSRHIVLRVVCNWISEVRRFTTIRSMASLYMSYIYPVPGCRSSLQNCTACSWWRVKCQRMQRETLLKAVLKTPNIWTPSCAWFFTETFWAISRESHFVFFCFCALVSPFCDLRTWETENACQSVCHLDW